MTVYVVVQDTGGAHEPEGAWSVWSTVDAALAEAFRLNQAYNNHPTYESDYADQTIAPARLNRPSGSSAFYVVPVELDSSRDDNIG